MKKLKLLSVFLLGSMLLTGCNSPKEDPSTQIRKVYDSYVSYAESQGIEPLSYEEWLDSIKGEKGDTGDVGPQGPKGDKGEKGDVGAAGKAGEDGAPGKDGQDGAPGKDGYTPVKGVDYFDGEDGYTPVKGVDYFDGEDGYTPVKGVDYFDGQDGAPGKDGQDGAPGKDGQDGAPGKDGQDGVPGKDGRDGVPGKDGEDGYTPIKGVDYFDGEDGAPGKDGKDGADGVSVTKVEINEDGDLIITLSKGDPINAGHLKDIVEQKKYTVNFYVGEDIVETYTDVLENSTIEKPEIDIPVMFWSVESYSKRYWDFDGYFADRVTGDLNLYAVDTHKITLNANGGTLSEEFVYATTGEEYELPTPTKEGDTFIGWYDVYGDKFDTSGVFELNEDIILNARYNKTTLYTLRFFDGNGVLLYTRQVAEGEYIGKVDLTRENYIFYGCFDSTYSDGFCNVYYIDDEGNFLYGDAFVGDIKLIDDEGKWQCGYGFDFYALYERNDFIFNSQTVTVKRNPYEQYHVDFNPMTTSNGDDVGTVVYQIAAGEGPMMDIGIEVLTQPTFTISMSLNCGEYNIYISASTYGSNGFLMASRIALITIIITD